MHNDYKNKSVPLLFIIKRVMMKLKVAFSVIVLLLVGIVNAYAQVEPCFGEDPDSGNCPLDTWVIALAIAASCFAAIRLYRDKKSVL